MRWYNPRGELCARAVKCECGTVIEGEALSVQCLCSCAPRMRKFQTLTADDEAGIQEAMERMPVTPGLEE